MLNSFEQRGHHPKAKGALVIGQQWGGGGQAGPGSLGGGGKQMRTFLGGQGGGRRGDYELRLQDLRKGRPMGLHI